MGQEETGIIQGLVDTLSFSGQDVLSAPSSTGRILKDCEQDDAVYQAGDWRAQRALCTPELLLFDLVPGILFLKNYLWGCLEAQGDGIILQRGFIFPSASFLQELPACDHIHPRLRP